MITDVLQSVYVVAKLIYRQAELAKANKAQCQSLVGRIKIIVQAIKKLEQVKDSDQYLPGLLALEKCLKDCARFVKEFSQEDSWFVQVLKAGTCKEQFALLNNGLETAISQLQLGLNAQQIMNREQDKHDQAQDYAYICQQQDILIKLNQTANQALQKMQLQQRDRDLILQQQLASLKAHIMALDVKKDPSQPPIDKELIVPYYELVFDKKIAEGGFGTVYQGKWAGQTVAIKTLHLESDNKEEDRPHFIREIQIMSHLRHDNIIRFYGACLEPKRECLVMEYAQQGTLYSALSNRTFTVEQQKHIVLDIARGLAYLHSREILHRDLKSANILLADNDQAKLADFGLAKTKAHSIQSAQHTSHSTEWRAPECFEKSYQATAESDIYSFGMVLWEVVTGKRPYAKYTDKRDQRIIKRVLLGKRETIPANVPEIYRQLILSCWQKDPLQRPTLKDIIKRLEAYSPKVIQDPAKKTQPVHDQESKATVPSTAKPNTTDIGEGDYQQGIAYEKQNNIHEAYTAYQKSVAKGYYKAYANLGFFALHGGEGIKKDKSQAFQLFSQGAAKNHVRAMTNLATMLEYGDGVDKDIDKALEWYSKAANLGDQQAKVQHDKLLQQKPEYQGNLQSSSSSSSSTFTSSPQPFHIK